MRLIDADYVTEKLNGINGTAELDEAYEVVENAPTIDVLDMIRAGIEAKEMIEITSEHQFYNMALDDVLQIIDKYKAESEDKE